MQVRWLAASLVVTAQSHNPSILSTEWLRKNGVSDEEPVNFAYTPLVGFYQGTSLQILVQPERLEFSLRNISEANLATLTSGAVRHVNALPHVPYTGVGVNMTWQGLPDRPDELQALTGVPEGSRYRQILGDGELSRGVLLQQVLPDRRLVVIGQPPTADGLKLDFNFHFTAKTVGDAVQALERAEECYARSRDVATQLFSQQVNA